VIETVAKIIVLAVATLALVVSINVNFAQAHTDEYNEGASDATSDFRDNHYNDSCPDNYDNTECRHYKVGYNEQWSTLRANSNSDVNGNNLNAQDFKTSQGQSASVNIKGDNNRVNIGQSEQTTQAGNGVPDFTLGQYWRSNGQKLEFIRKREGVKYPEYWVEPREHRLIDNLWTDIEAYNYSSDYPTEKHTELIERIITNFSNEGDLIADFFAGSGTTLVVAERKGRQWIGSDFSKVAVQIARNRLVHMDSRPFLIENIGNYQLQLIYLTGSRIYEIQPIILKLYGSTPRKDYPDLGTRKTDQVDELVYVSYPDRPVTAKKVEELEALAETLDGRGYPQLVILGWDYEYNYDEILRERERLSKRIWHTKVVSKTIPPEVYDYLKKLKTTDEIDSINGKIQFYEKPYLKLLKPEIQASQGKYKVTVGIDRYVVFDYPIEKEEDERGVQELVKEKPLSIIDYWAVDWDYDGITFKSMWQAMRKTGRNVIPIPKDTSKELEGGKSYTIAIRVVDIFGNDASNTVNVDLRNKN